MMSKESVSNIVQEFVIMNPEYDCQWAFDIDPMNFIVRVVDRSNHDISAKAIIPSTPYLDGEGFTCAIAVLAAQVRLYKR